MDIDVVKYFLKKVYVWSGFSTFPDILFIITKNTEVEL